MASHRETGSGRLPRFALQIASSRPYLRTQRRNMSISCEISWEKAASLLQECKTESTVLHMESTLKEDDFKFFKGIVTDVSQGSRAVTFRFDSGGDKPFNFASATSFVLAVGRYGNWELRISLGEQGRVEFTSGDGVIDPPSPMV
jgi:hypothetical protein